MRLIKFTAAAALAAVAVVIALVIGARHLLDLTVDIQAGQATAAPWHNTPGPTPQSDGSGTPEFIRSVTVSPMSEGTRYNVAPTRAGRLATGDALTFAGRQAVAKGVPDRPGLEQQFMCHPLSIVARAKPTWDLEDWRPTVGLTRTMMMACNPL